MDGMDAKTTFFRRGMIMLWSGSIASIPGGWALCNGGNGTPDLTDYFIVGAGNLYNPGDAGGSDTHKHDIDDVHHRHYLVVGDEIAAGTDFDNETGPESEPFRTDIEPHLPPYVALAYIMKL